MKKKVFIILGGILSFILIVIIGLLITYKVMLRGSKNNEVVTFVVNQGETSKQIIDNLKDNNLIKNKYATYIYLKLHKDLFLQAGTYELNKNMNVKEIFDCLTKGKVFKDGIRITFKEGLWLSDYVKIASKVFNFDYDEVLKEVDDKKYVQSLIDKYWFLDDVILDSKIKHPLEGYLFADTYSFEKDSNIKDVIEVMLRTMDSKLSKYKTEIENRGLSVHEILTLASIIEGEGKTVDDRRGIAGALTNRLNRNISLGCDATTRYAVEKHYVDENGNVQPLLYPELNDCSNAYNTRCLSYIGLPIGPIGSPSLSSIEAALNPDENDYLYWISDCSGKVYFHKTGYEQQLTINRLSKEGNWCSG